MSQHPTTFSYLEDSPDRQRMARRRKYAMLLEYIEDVGTPDGSGGYKLGAEAGRQMPGILSQNLRSWKGTHRNYVYKGKQDPCKIDVIDGVYYVNGRPVPEDQIETIDRECIKTSFDRSDQDWLIPGTPEFHVSQYLIHQRRFADGQCEVSAAAMHHLRKAVSGIDPISKGYFSASILVPSAADETPSISPESICLPSDSA